MNPLKAFVIFMVMLPSTCMAARSITGRIVPADSTMAEKMVAKLNKFITAHPVEKAYLQFDKPYYAAGDTIYFKAYITAGERHELSNISGVLHVDLINTGNKIDQSIKLQVDSGLAHGDFALPDSLPAGNYHIRAYTRWMRNNGENSYFSQAIVVGSTLKAKIPESGVSAKTSDQPEIQLLPEGGSLVAGLRSKVAFKAIGSNGLGVNVKGVIVDNDNNEVCQFASAHLGMGYFYLTPMEGKTYKANLNYAGGGQNTVELPPAATDGIVLSVNNDSIPNAALTIEANKPYFQQNRGKSYTLLIYAGGVATRVSCTLDTAVINLNILKRHIRSGVATVTLFSPEGSPLCERLLFVQSYDQLDLGLNADKTSYPNRGKVKITLNARTRAGDGAAGHFSVSVIDESKLPVDKNSENTIISNLLLTSDLKGYVEQPNYYFTDTSVTARKKLDILLLTQGYRRFTWKQVMSGNYPTLQYQPERGIEITGKVENPFGKRVSNGVATLIPTPRGPLLTAVTDNDGMFHFSGIVFTDSARFVLSAVNARGRNSTKITYISEPPPSAGSFQPVTEIRDTTIMSSLNNDRLQHNTGIKRITITGKTLKEVNIKSRKIQPLTISSRWGVANQVITNDQIPGAGLLPLRLVSLLRGVHFVIDPLYHQFVPVTNVPPGGLVQIVVNGSEMPAGFNLESIDADEVESIELFKDATISQAGAGLSDQPEYAAILSITTNRALKAKHIASVGILPIAVKGFYKAREFYSPKYDNPDRATIGADLRSTIYWNPELVTDKDGNATFEYFNADGTGSYKVIVEGIDNKGNLGRKVYRYRVSD